MFNMNATLLYGRELEVINVCFEIFLDLTDAYNLDTWFKTMQNI